TSSRGPASSTTPTFSISPRNRSCARRSASAPHRSGSPITRRSPPWGGGSSSWRSRRPGSARPRSRSPPWAADPCRARPRAQHGEHVDANARVAILVADDRAENVVALRAILDDPSYEVIGVHSGQKAVEVAETRDDLALILLDVHMPGLDGLATARRIRERKVTAPIIFLTADSFDDRLMSQAYA